MSDEATVLTDEADGVLVITINRPEAKNAVNLSVAQGVAAALERLDSDDSLRVGVLTGAGGTFCAGMDLKAFVSGEFPHICLLYTSPSPRDATLSRMPSSA